MHRNPFTDHEAPSLAEVRARIADDLNFPLRRRAAVLSAISSAGRWFGTPLTAIPANTDFLRRRFATVAPSQHGVSAARLANVRSDVLFALRHLGLVGRTSYLAPLSPEWEELWDRLPNKYARTSFSRFFRYCSARQLSPAGVDAAVAEAFHSALCAETLVKDPWSTYQNLCRAWNRMRGQVPGWPNTELPVPSRTDHYTLPWSSFPACLHAEVMAYVARLGHDDPLDLLAPPRKLKPRTLQVYEYQLRRFASLLVLAGVNANSIDSISVLVEPGNVQRGLRVMLDRHGTTRTRTAYGLADILGKVARHWVDAPQEWITTIKKYAGNLRPQESGLSSRNRARLAPLRNEANLARLFLLPGKIRSEIGGRHNPNRADALLVQSGVALMILTHAPLRVSNLASLSLERHLRWSQPGMKGSLVVDIGGDEVKNGLSLSFPLPDECSDMIRLYLRCHHVLLAKGPNEFLFPGGSPGKAKRADTLSKQLSRLVRNSIGLEVNPHLYRHLVHLVVLNRYPGAYAMISRILGHRSLQTAISNYAGEDISIAMRAYQELVNDVKATRPVRPKHSATMVGLSDLAVKQGRGR